MKKNTTRKFDPAGPFTTGQIQKMLGVSSRTVLKWCDKGMLPHYAMPRMSNGLRGGDRRVTREELLEFIAKYGLPIPEQLRSEFPLCKHLFENLDHDRLTYRCKNCGLLTVKVHTQDELPVDGQILGVA